MQTRLIKLRFRRQVRKGQQQVEGLGSLAEEGLEQHLFGRFSRLKRVRRFALGWLSLVAIMIIGLIAQNILLGGYYQTVRTVPGGIYREGLVGRFTNANPLYATTEADASVSRLIFASLFTYDSNGKLVGDLASSYDVDARGTSYTVHLRPGLTWQDGKPLTSADVVFTYQEIENPDAQSPLLSSWQGISVTAPDSRTVVFKLPDPLAAFAYNLTNGIVPKHILGSVPAADLRSADFNTVHPVGAGPFAWQAVEVNGADPANAQQQVALVPFEHYHAGKPKLQKFIVRSFASSKQLRQAFLDNQLTAAEGLQKSPVTGDSDTVIAHSILLRAANMVFFKNSAGVLADAQVRQALVQGADTSAIIKSLGYATHSVREPLLRGQLGYDASLEQPAHDLKAAAKILDDDGWVMGGNGTRTKDKQSLSFTLSIAEGSEYRQVAQKLQSQWKALGVKLSIRTQNPSEFQSTLSYHDYDAVLYGISIGIDPDVFVYWDSSQADVRSANRLNLSEYKSNEADAALEAGRTRLDSTLRVVKYKPFLQAWQHDNPALGLYQPRLLYLTNGTVSGLTQAPINTATDRFANVNNWEIRQAKVTN